MLAIMIIKYTFKWIYKIGVYKNNKPKKSNFCYNFLLLFFKS